MVESMAKAGLLAFLGEWSRDEARGDLYWNGQRVGVGAAWARAELLGGEERVLRWHDHIVVLSPDLGRRLRQLSIGAA